MISCSCNQSVIIGAHAAPSLDFVQGLYSSKTVVKVAAKLDKLHDDDDDDDQCYGSWNPHDASKAMQQQQIPNRHSQLASQIGLEN